jgi:hypothetical protein
MLLEAHIARKGGGPVDDIQIRDELAVRQSALVPAPGTVRPLIRIAHGPEKTKLTASSISTTPAPLRIHD